MASAPTVDGPRTVTPAEMKFDAFISYSRKANLPLAVALQRGLHSFAKPAYRLRALRTFRDESTLSLTPELWPEIEHSIKASRFFLLLANPSAAGSRWVEREVSVWLRLGRQQNILIIWTGGEIRWDGDAGDFDWEHTTALSKQFAGVFKQEPLYFDLTSVAGGTHFEKGQPDIRLAVAKVAARIRNMSLDEIFGEDVRQHQRTRFLVGFFIFVLALTTAIATRNWSLELAARKEAQARQREAQEQRAEAIKQKGEAERQRTAADEQANIAKSRLSQVLHERSVVESEEHQQQIPALLLECQATLAAPDTDPRRDLYRLRALYLATREPREVHQLPTLVSWAMMPRADRAVTFVHLPDLELWDTRTWRLIGRLNVDPKHVPVTDVAPYGSIDRRTFEVVAHEAVDLSSTMGNGWNNYQTWDLDSGAMRESAREISYKSFQNSRGVGLLSRNAISVQELVDLRKSQPNFSRVLETIAAQPARVRLYPKTTGNVPATDQSLDAWVVDAAAATGDFIIATQYGRDVPWTNTWNGATDQTVTYAADPSFVFVWKDGTYQVASHLKEAYQHEFPRLAGFGRVKDRTLMWVVKQDHTLLVMDPKTSEAVRPPILLPSDAWVDLADGPSGLRTIESTGRAALRSPMSDPGAPTVLDTELEFGHVAIQDDTALTATGYSPLAKVRREVAVWRLSQTQQASPLIPDERTPFGTANELAASPSGRYVAALADGEITVFDRGKNMNRVLNMPVHPTPRDTLPYCPEGGIVQFRGEHELIWCEERDVKKTYVKPLTQGSMTMPAESGWTIRLGRIGELGPLPDRAGARIDPGERLVALAGDGTAFLTWNYESSRLTARSVDTGSPIATVKSADPSFAHFVPIFFRGARNWRGVDDALEGDWHDGITIRISDRTIRFRQGTRIWDAHDPSATPSAENARWKIEKQRPIAVSPSGRVIATVSLVISRDSRDDRPGQYIRMWEVATGEPLSGWLWHEAPVEGAGFTSDGWLRTITNLGRSRRWPAEVVSQTQSAWIDDLAEPLTGVRLGSGNEVLKLSESELKAARSKLEKRISDARSRQDAVAVWFRKAE